MGTSLCLSLDMLTHATATGLGSGDGRRFADESTVCKVTQVLLFVFLWLLAFLLIPNGSKVTSDLPDSGQNLALGILALGWGIESSNNNIAEMTPDTAKTWWTLTDPDAAQPNKFDDLKWNDRACAHPCCDAVTNVCKTTGRCEVNQKPNKCTGCVLPIGSDSMSGSVDAFDKDGLQSGNPSAFASNNNRALQD